MAFIAQIIKKILHGMVFYRLRQNESGFIIFVSGIISCIAFFFISIFVLYMQSTEEAKLINYIFQNAFVFKIAKIMPYDTEGIYTKKICMHI
jgi:uncharacterized membrane protein HdeD (DUF308 family)